MCVCVCVCVCVRVSFAGDKLIANKLHTTVRQCDNYNQKSHKYVRLTNYQLDTKSNPNSNPNPSPNPNPTSKQHAIVNIPLNIVTCTSYPDNFIRDTLLRRLYQLRLSLSHCFAVQIGNAKISKSTKFKKFEKFTVCTKFTA